MQNLAKDLTEFNLLFEELSGIEANSADKDTEGFLFIPKEANLGEKDKNKRSRIAELAGHSGWKNHIVDDDYSGWWIHPPTQTTLNYDGTARYN